METEDKSFVSDRVGVTGLMEFYLKLSSQSFPTQWDSEIYVLSALTDSRCAVLLSQFFHEHLSWFLTDSRLTLNLVVQAQNRT